MSELSFVDLFKIMEERASSALLQKDQAIHTLRLELDSVSKQSNEQILLLQNNLEFNFNDFYSIGEFTIQENKVKELEEVIRELTVDKEKQNEELMDLRKTICESQLLISNSNEQILLLQNNLEFNFNDFYSIGESIQENKVKELEEVIRELTVDKEKQNEELMDLRKTICESQLLISNSNEQILLLQNNLDSIGELTIQENKVKELEEVIRELTVDKEKQNEELMDLRKTICESQLLISNSNELSPNAKKRRSPHSSHSSTELGSSATHSNYTIQSSTKIESARRSLQAMTHSSNDIKCRKDKYDDDDNDNDDDNDDDDDHEEHEYGKVQRTLGQSDQQMINIRTSYNTNKTYTEASTNQLFKLDEVKTTENPVVGSHVVVSDGVSFSGKKNDLRFMCTIATPVVRNQTVCYIDQRLGGPKTRYMEGHTGRLKNKVFYLPQLYVIKPTITNTKNVVSNHKRSTKQMNVKFLTFSSMYNLVSYFMPYNQKNVALMAYWIATQDGCLTLDEHYIYDVLTNEKLDDCQIFFERYTIMQFTDEIGRGWGLSFDNLFKRNSRNSGFYDKIPIWEHMHEFMHTQTKNLTILSKICSAVFLPVAFASVFEELENRDKKHLMMIRSCIDCKWSSNFFKEFHSLTSCQEMSLSLVNGIRNGRGIICYWKSGFYPATLKNTNEPSADIYMLRMHKGPSNNISILTRTLFDQILHQLIGSNETTRLFIQYLFDFYMIRYNQKMFNTIFVNDKAANDYSEWMVRIQEIVKANDIDMESTKNLIASFFSSLEGET